MERKINKTGYVSSELAQEDLREIFRTSMVNWGMERAKDYAVSIEETIELIAAQPDRGISREALFPAAPCFPVGSHVIFYRKVGVQIEIARVLHSRMDFQRHF